MKAAKDASRHAGVSARRASFAGGRLDRLSPAGETSRAMLLRAAAETFAETGFAEASIDQVARRCGATKGLVYHHYRSKGDLYLDAARWGLGHLEAAILAPATSRERAATRLKGMAEAHLTALLGEPAARHARRGRLPPQLVRQQPDEAEKIAQLAAAHDARFAKALEDARREGDADGRADLAVALGVLLAILDLPARETSPGDPRDLARAALRAAGMEAAILDEEFA